MLLLALRWLLLIPTMTRKWRFDVGIEWSIYNQALDKWEEQTSQIQEECDTAIYNNTHVPAGTWVYCCIFIFLAF